MKKRTYEIEIKSLLGSDEAAQRLRDVLKEHDSDLVSNGSHSQLNHYFIAPEDVSHIDDVVGPHIREEKRAELKEIMEEGHSYSVRTRDADGDVYFIVKASLGSDSSENGVKRIEFEEKVDISIEELDELLLENGFSYQAKWSREREEYQSNDMNITIDKNAGYGFVAEFEKVVEDESLVASAHQEICNLMETLGIKELPQDRLERMFAHYNEHWQDYYGTDTIFTIE